MKRAGQWGKSRHKGPEADLRARERESRVGVGSGESRASCAGNVSTQEDGSRGVEETSVRHVNNRLPVGKQPRQAAPEETQMRDKGLGQARPQWRREVVAERGGVRKWSRTCGLTSQKHGAVPGRSSPW